jgi:hypothetical protein
MNNTAIASFSTNDWSRILFALQTYVINQEYVLSKQNVGDREWEELESYTSLINDIEMYVLGETK